MKIVDREQERIQQEQTPAGKRKKRIRNLATGIAIVAAIAMIYLINHHPAFAGSPIW